MSNADYILQFDGMLRTTEKEWPTQNGLLGYGWLIQWGHVEIAPGARPHIPVDMDAPIHEFEAIAAKFPVFRVTRI